MRIVTVCGSLRQGSTNAAALRTAASLAPDDIEIDSYGGLAELPHFNPDDEQESPAVVRLRERLDQADAVLFSTPEYAGALPGVFKNLLEWCVSTGSLYRKPVAWINISASSTGAADAYASLRTVLGYLGVALVEQACAHIPITRDLVGEDGLVHDEAVRARIRDAVAALAKAS